MPRTRRPRDAAKQAAKEDPRIFRYWIELKNLQDGTMRVLPLTAHRLVPLVAEGHPADGQERTELRVEDHSRKWVATSIDDLAAQLRAAYPDGAYERFLR